MPWTGRSFKKHNGKLSAPQSSKAATIANAVLQKSGDEGTAIAVANKKLSDMRKRGVISDRAAEKRGLASPPSPLASPPPLTDPSNPPRDVDASSR